jgi:hypothetical protein
MSPAAGDRPESRTESGRARYRVLLGVSGGIAAYKAGEVLRRLLDFSASWGAAALGHSHPALREAVNRGGNGQILLSTIFKFAGSKEPIPNSTNWIVLVDDSDFVARNLNNLLWTVFTRSDPAADPRRSLLAWWKQQTGLSRPRPTRFWPTEGYAWSPTCLPMPAASSFHTWSGYSRVKVLPGATRRCRSVCAGPCSVR